MTINNQCNDALLLSQSVSTHLRLCRLAGHGGRDAWPLLWQSCYVSGGAPDGRGHNSAAGEVCTCPVQLQHGRGGPPSCSLRRNMAAPCYIGKYHLTSQQFYIFCMLHTLACHCNPGNVIASLAYEDIVELQIPWKCSISVVQGSLLL